MPNPKIGSPDPPAFLAKVPKTVIRALDLSQVLQGALNSMGAAANYGPVVALGDVDSYFDAARRQQRRIGRTRVSILRSVARGKAVGRLGSIFPDVHFYLISWAKIAKLTRFLRGTTRFRRTGLVLRKYHADLEERIDARDHLEHFEERLPGGQKQSKLAVPNDLGNLVNDYFTYGGCRVDIGPDSFRVLKRFRDEFSEALLYDSLEAVMQRDGSRFSAFLRMAASKVHVARATRKIRRSLEDTR